jgi:hypothetical protein
VGTRGDVHLVLVERMLLIGTDVTADVVGPKTLVERNAYLVFAHGLVQPFRRGSIEDDADLAGGALIGDAIGLVGLL